MSKHVKSYYNSIHDSIEYKRKNTLKGWLNHIWLVILSITKKSPYGNNSN